MSAGKYRKEKNCLNCGHEVEEHFCTHCGQENIELKEDAWHMVYHAVADYFHFEHKFFGTIKPLLFQPGVLTKEYVSGKRVSFIHPIRLYIFISIVFFLFILGGQKKEKAEEEKAKTEVNGVKKPPTPKDLKEVEDAIKYIPVSPDIKDSIMKEAKKNIEKEKKDSTYTSGKKGKWKNNWVSKDSTVDAYEKHQLALPKDERDGFVKHYIVQRSIEVNHYPNPKEKFIEDLLHNVPKMMFLLLPLFAMILKLVYINKNRYYYEHLIYSFHLHSAIFLSILFSMLLSWAFSKVHDISGYLSFFITIYIIWYIYRSLRTFYGSTRWITVLKMFFLSFCYNVLLVICFLIIAAVSFVMI